MGKTRRLIGIAALVFAAAGCQQQAWVPSGVDWWPAEHGTRNDTPPEEHEVVCYDLGC